MINKTNVTLFISALLMLLWALAQPAQSEIVTRSDGLGPSSSARLAGNDGLYSRPRSSRRRQPQSDGLNIANNDASELTYGQSNKWSHLNELAQRVELAEETYCSARAASNYDSQVTNVRIWDWLRCAWKFIKYPIVKEIINIIPFPYECCYLDIFGVIKKCRDHTRKPKTTTTTTTKAPDGKKKKKNKNNKNSTTTTTTTTEAPSNDEDDEETIPAEKSKGAGAADKTKKPASKPSSKPSSAAQEASKRAVPTKAGGKPKQPKDKIDYDNN